MCLTVCVSVCLYVYAWASLCLFICLSVCLFLCQSVFVCLSIYVVFLYLCMFSYLPVCPSIYVSVFMSVFMSVCLSLLLSKWAYNQFQWKSNSCIETRNSSFLRCTFYASTRSRNYVFVLRAGRLLRRSFGAPAVASVCLENWLTLKAFVLSRRHTDTCPENWRRREIRRKSARLNGTAIVTRDVDN